MGNFWFVTGAVGFMRFRQSAYPCFERKKVTINSKPQRNPAIKPTRSALIVNSSHEMASAISSELHEKMPSFSLLYAPTIQVAKIILERRRVDLILSDAMLPDGSITGLLPSLEKIVDPPDLVVIGNLNAERERSLLQSGYNLNTVFPLEAELGPAIESEPENTPIENKVRELGADLRDRLNNPLQEIVAMAFVAQSTPSAAPSTIEALTAIQSAAKNMAGVVNALEDKIRKTLL